MNGRNSNSIIKRSLTLTDELAKKLNDAIKSGVYKPGDRLPTEPELCETYGVSRPVLREAISQLKSNGLVIPQQGRGVFVSETGHSASMRLDIPSIEDKQEVLQILELLMAVEVYSTGLAARCRTKKQLTTIKKALDKLIKAISAGEVANEEDMIFHAEIVKATNNRFILTLSSFLEENVRHAIRTARRNTSTSKDYNSIVIKEHEDIYLAIEEQNIENARLAAETHLKKAAERLMLIGTS
jgi:GntR family transcriptional repressor for pyruvate dehydrogenase complex